MPMKPALSILSVAALLLGAGAALADLPRPFWCPAPPRPPTFGRPISAPPKPAPNAVPITIEPTDGNDPRLIIPKNLLPRAQSAAHLEDREAPRAPLFAGVALGGLLVGGFALTGRGRAARRLLLTLLPATALFIAHGPIQAKAQLPGLFPVEVEGLRVQPVRVEITEDGDRVRHLLPRARFADLAGNLKAR